MVCISCPRFPGVQKPLDQYGPSETSGGGGGDGGDDDDDFDLFGSDDEEEVCVCCPDRPAHGCTLINTDKIHILANIYWCTHTHTHMHKHTHKHTLSTHTHKRTYTVY